MLCIFQRADRNDLPALRTAMQEHHRLYATLYHCTAKVHGQVHRVDYWDSWGPLLSCYGPERHHKLFERVCSYSFNKFERSSLAHDVRTWIGELSKPELYMPMDLSGKRKPCNFSVDWPGCSQAVLLHEWAGSLTTEMGLLSKGDLVQYSGDGTLRVAWVLGFAATTSSDVGHFVAVVQYCDMISTSVWRRTERVGVVIAKAIEGSVPWVALGATDVGVLLHPARSA